VYSSKLVGPTKIPGMPLGHFVTELASGESYSGPPPLPAALASKLVSPPGFRACRSALRDRASKRRIHTRPTALRRASRRFARSGPNPHIFTAAGRR
jgi:hypothetical protein